MALDNGFCIKFPPPTISEMFNSIKGWKPSFQEIEVLGGIIGIPYPIFLGISQATNEVSQIIQYMKEKLTFTNLLTMLKSFISVVGGKLKDLIPNIPIININPIELFDMDSNAIRDLIKGVYQTSKDSLLNFLSAFLPTPIFNGFSVPDWEINAIIKAIYAYCNNLVLSIASSLANKVASILEITKTFSLPTLPKMDGISEKLKTIVEDLIFNITGEVNKFSTVFEAISVGINNFGLSFNKIFSSISFSGFTLVKLSLYLILVVSHIVFRKICKFWLVILYNKVFQC